VNAMFGFWAQLWIPGRLWYPVIYGNHPGIRAKQVSIVTLTHFPNVSSTMKCIHSLTGHLHRYN